MIPALKAEIRKLLSVRSTYVIVALALALEVFMAFFIAGWRADILTLHGSGTLADSVARAIRILSIFPALVGLLLFTHEFRYNTIAYSLTLSNSRSKVLAAKIIVVSVFAIIFTLITGALSPLLTLWGIQVHHLHLITQSIPYGSLLWKGLFYGWGYAMAGLVIAALVRNQIGAIVTLFIVPGTVEAILMLWLKQNIVYLPFNALNTVIGRGIGTYPNAITPFHAVLVFCGYLFIGWLIAWVLFIRRDAA